MAARPYRDLPDRRATRTYAKELGGGPLKDILTHPLASRLRRDRDDDFFHLLPPRGQEGRTRWLTGVHRLIDKDLLGNQKLRYYKQDPDDREDDSYERDCWRDLPEPFAFDSALERGEYIHEQIADWVRLRPSRWREKHGMWMPQATRFFDALDDLLGLDYNPERCWAEVPVVAPSMNLGTRADLLLQRADESGDSGPLVLVEIKTCCRTEYERIDRVVRRGLFSKRHPLNLSQRSRALLQLAVQKVALEDDMGAGMGSVCCVLASVDFWEPLEVVDEEIEWMVRLLRHRYGES